MLTPAIKILQPELENIGGLSNPSKMPCYSWSIPTKYCQTGRKLAQHAQTICSHCYVDKGFYQYPAAQKAMERRYKILQHALDNPADRLKFVLSFTKVLEYLRTRERGKQHAHFRWFDSGDLQSELHLSIISDIAALTPEVEHWLPTHEYRIVHNWMEDTHTELPDNLTIRISAAMIGGKLPNLCGLPVSVSGGDSSPEVYDCPAYDQGGECGDCRACWDTHTDAVRYQLH